MKMFLFVLAAVFAVGSTLADEVRGKVSEASGETALIIVEGEVAPSVGDAVEIFFTLAGGDDEISVATGKVASVDGKIVNVAIQNASGTVAKDQVARFTAGSSQANQTAPAATPTVTGTTGAPSLVGDWVANFPDADSTQISFSFKEDGTLLWVVEGPEYEMSTRAKYRIDPSTQPQGIELFDLEEGELKGERSSGIFELQSDGRLKLDFPKGPEGPPMKEFTKHALVFSKAASPIVRSNKPSPPTPTPYVAPTPSPDEVLMTEAIQRYERGDDAEAMEALEKAIVLNPKNARAYFYRGLCFHRKKELTPAIADFEKAMELDPSMKLEDLILKTRAVRGTERAKPTPSPTRANKRKP